MIALSRSLALWSLRTPSLRTVESICVWSTTRWAERVWKLFWQSQLRYLPRSSPPCRRLTLEGPQYSPVHSPAIPSRPSRGWRTERRSPILSRHCALTRWRRRTRECTSALFATTRRAPKPVLSWSWEDDVSETDSLKEVFRSSTEFNFYSSHSQLSVDPPIIRQGFPEETIHPGPSVFLKCIAGGNPTPEISWELDGKKIANNERYQIGQYVTVNGDVVSYLNISSIHRNDGGLYKCIATSKVGVAEHAAKQNVYGVPYIRPMEKKYIVAGETLIVTCPVAGFPIESIIWERGESGWWVNGKPGLICALSLPPDNRALPINRKQKVFPNGTLIIENVERNSDQASYTCVAKNAEGFIARGAIEIEVMGKLSILLGNLSLQSFRKWGLYRFRETHGEQLRLKSDVFLSLSANSPIWLWGTDWFAWVGIDQLCRL